MLTIDNVISNLVRHLEGRHTASFKISKDQDIEVFLIFFYAFVSQSYTKAISQKLTSPGNVILTC